LPPLEPALPEAPPALVPVPPEAPTLATPLEPPLAFVPDAPALDVPPLAPSPPVPARLAPVDDGVELELEHASKARGIRSTIFRDMGTRANALVCQCA
ncbi:MAG TPA: hypothetical protein VGI70_14380, partial [Polyangiales bacterium]